MADPGAAAPIRIATGEHAANAVIFTQLLQAEAIDIVQLDVCRVAGVNENVAIMLLAAKFGVPVGPHAGGSVHAPVRPVPGRRCGRSASSGSGTRTARPGCTRDAGSGAD